MAVSRTPPAIPTVRYPEAAPSTTDVVTKGSRISDFTFRTTATSRNSTHTTTCGVVRARPRDGLQNKAACQITSMAMAVQPRPYIKGLVRRSAE
jgi:hypothetical protein